MLGVTQKTVALPHGATGLALEGTALRVLGADTATAQAYLDQVRAAWLDIVRADATKTLTRAAAAAFRRIREELAEAEEAENLGVPPPGGRSAAEVQVLLDQGRQAFQRVYQAVENAASIAEINDTVQQARDSGLTWLVGLDWEPYPEECPWTIASK